MRDRPKKITERDVEQLNQSLPHSDRTAEQLQTPTYQGTIEEIEERYWRGETLGPDEDDEP